MSNSDETDTHTPSRFDVTPDRQDTATTLHAADHVAAALAFVASDHAGWGETYDDLLWVSAHGEPSPGRAIRVRVERDLEAEAAWAAGEIAVKL